MRQFRGRRFSRNSPSGSSQKKMYQKLRSRNELRKCARYAVLPCISRPKRRGERKTWVIFHCRLVSAASAANQDVAIHKAAGSGWRSDLLDESHHARVNTIRNGTNDSFAVAPRMPAMGSIQ